jgi:hypothetical protein
VRAALDTLEQGRRAAADLERKAAEARNRANPPVQPGAHDDSQASHDAATYEDVVVTNLHAQAAGVQNIRALVLIVLDPLLLRLA